MNATTLFIYTETSLHAGVGSSVSAIDLPIQREKTTQFPIVQGSGLKGALRSQAKSTDNSSDIEAVFGPNTKNGDMFAGSLSVGDARTILFPVRSLAGVFAYTTCPAILARLARDLPEYVDFPAYIYPNTPNTALVSSNSTLLVGANIVLEEFTFEASSSEAVETIAAWLAANAFPAVGYDYWKTKLLTSLVILPDDAFRDFVQNSTEVVTRVKLNAATKTVDGSGLWTQEALPSDTLLMSCIVTRASRKPDYPLSADQVAQKLGELIPPRIQLGGDETTGQGVVALRWL